jgi:hypothetical protein
MEQQQGEVIFEGTVQAMGPPPSEWSGTFSRFQEVRYVVEEAIRGALPGATLVVCHPVVKDSPTAQPGNVPSLASRLFGAGARLVVMAVEDPVSPRFVASAHFGVMPYSRLLAERLRALVTP